MYHYNPFFIPHNCLTKRRSGKDELHKFESKIILKKIENFKNTKTCEIPARQPDSSEISSLLDGVDDMETGL